MDHPPSFLADSMLGKLARWLRVMGVDAAYERNMDDADLVEKSLSEGRVLLTRDRRLLERRRLRHGFQVESDDPMKQVAEVAKAFGLALDPDRLFRRCLECNVSLEDADPETVQAEVPPYVRATQERFARCTRCGRVYWAATHIEGMRRQLEEALSDEATS